MKHHNVFKGLLLGGTLAVSLSACDENAWNDEYLNGFEQPSLSKAEIVSYNLNAADIKKMAQLSANRTLAAERGESALLQAVGNQGFFTAQITPEVYAPAWLDSLAGVKGSFVYYLDQKSTLQLNFPTSDALPAELTGISEATEVTVDEAQYQAVWESETDFIEAFAPSKPASKAIPGILAEAVSNPAKGQFAVVTYNVASQDPVFGGSSTPEPTPSYEISSTIGSLALNTPIEATGVVTGICKQGYILTDLSGSTLVYYGNTFDMTPYAIGQVRTVAGTGGCFGGCLQIASPTDELVGTTEYAYPTPIEVTAELFEQYSAERQALKAADNGGAPVYAEIKGATFTQSGNYINFSVPGADAEKAAGSGYQVPQNIIDILTFGAPVDVKGYVIGCSGKAYVTFLVTEVNGKTPAKTRKIASRAVNVSSKQEKAAYSYNGSAWTACQNVLVLNAEDYAQMTGYNNLTATQAATFLPIYLSNKYPYAQEGAEYFVVYTLKDGSNTINNFTSRATFTGTAWELTTINTDMMQFVLAPAENGWSKWIYDPTVYIDLPAGRNASSAPFWQACVDWVFENIDGPEFNSESITSGVGYVTKYGNNDYYSGASAYQCNVDLRPGSARAQTPSVYDSMSDEEVVATMKANFELRVLPAVLGKMYPDAQPGKGIDQFYVITFVMYNGSSHNEEIRYLVTAPGTFEFVSCTWNEE